MAQNVLDGVMAIEAKAAGMVDDAKAKAKEARERVQAELDALAGRLDEEAGEQIAQHARGVEARKQAALAELDGQLDAALAAVEAVKAERVAPLADEVIRLLEQRAHGD